MGGFVWKVLGTGSAVLAGIAARKALITGWQKVTGHPPPANPASRTTSWPEAVGFALMSGALMGLARMLAARKAADFYEKSAGHLPPGVDEVS